MCACAHVHVHVHWFITDVLELSERPALPRDVPRNRFANYRGMPLMEGGPFIFLALSPARGREEIPYPIM